ncbi:MAG: hypothetical protein JSW11_05425 [Candidatus Heimdallarchaeota archaeon]|nr:MAG: hypothetical protein JSW11_05425 [Candidatus Heimdallarchaeota archaeon]
MFTLVIFNIPLNPNPAVAELGDDYYEDFENTNFAALGWVATGLWHIEDNDFSTWPVSDIPSGSHYAWYGMNTTGNFNTGDSNSGELTSDSINLTKLTTPIELGFWSWAETEDGEDVDRKLIYISGDGGFSWDQLGMVPVSYDWQYWGFNITDYSSSEDVKIRFSFDTVDEIENNQRGWMLDNITIGSPRPRYDLSIMQESHAYVGDIQSINFLAESFFGVQTHVNISIIMETPSGTEILYKEYDYPIDEYGTWNYNIPYGFMESGSYTVIFILTDFDTGTEWIVDCLWEIGYFELSIEQDSTAFVDQEKWMDFYLDSYFGSWQYVDIRIVITPPMGYNETLFEEFSIYIGAYDTWHISLPYKFHMSGTHYVNFMVFDEYGVKWDIYCPWYVENEGIDIWIDQEYQAGITENRKMGFFICSYYDISMDVNISIIMETPIGENITLFSEPFIWMTADGYWEEWFDYTFTQTGVYVVYFIVIDEFGVEWAVTCPWEIKTDFFDLWIEQENSAGVTDWQKMAFHSKSYFNHGMEVNISIDIMFPSGPIENLYSEDFVYVGAFGFWDYALEFQFTEPGSYTVIFSIVDEYGIGWSRECPWYIESDFIGTKIEQDMDAIVGDTRTMGFHAKNYFDHGMYIDVLIEIHTPWGTDLLFDDDSIWIDSYSNWDISIDYTFFEPGEYKVFFVVIDENNDEWPIDCYWKVHEPGEKERFELKIDCDRSVNVGDQETIKFIVTSYFSHSMDVQINASIKTPDGSLEILFSEMVWIDEYGIWEREFLYYEYKEVGQYKVVFVLVDDIGAEWIVDERIDSDPETTETTEESNPPTIGATPGFESLLIIGTIAVIALYYRKHHK